MATKEYAGKAIELNDEGYMVDASQWSREVASAMATENNLELTEKHYEVLEYIRGKVERGENLTIRAVGKSGVIDIKGFYKLFPGAPLRNASKYAGIPKPTSCV